MAYTYDDYIKDCYVVEHGDSNMATNAKIRKNFYERGRADRIPLAFKQYRDADDYEYYEEREKERDAKREMGFWGLVDGLIGLLDSILSIAVLALIIFGIYKLLW